MRYILTFAGILLAATGGVIAYRAAFVLSRTSVVISEGRGVSQQPNWWSILLGLALLLAGAGVAYIAARPRRRS